jgi:hypothetical protein
VSWVTNAVAISEVWNMVSRERCEGSCRELFQLVVLYRHSEQHQNSQLCDKSNKILSTEIVYQTVTNLDCSLPLTDPHANWTDFCPEDGNDLFLRNVDDHLQTTRHYNAEDQNLHFYRRENLKCHSNSKFPTARSSDLNKNICLKVANIYLLLPAIISPT